VKRAFGCAALLSLSGVQSLPCQSIACAGGSPSMPSHQTSPSSVSATLVKIVLALIDSIAPGWSRRRAGRHPEETGLGVDRVDLPVLAGLDPGDVVADRRDLPALVLEVFGGTIIAKLVLPQALGKAAAT
jgi:hypothetical protein